MKGFSKISFVAIRFSSVSKMDGNSNKLVMRETSSVIEIRIPIATVPPKEDAAKMAKPKNKIVLV